MTDRIEDFCVRLVGEGGGESTSYAFLFVLRAFGRTSPAKCVGTTDVQLFIDLCTIMRVRALPGGGYSQSARANDRGRFAWDKRRQFFTIVWCRIDINSGAPPSTDETVSKSPKLADSSGR